MRFPEKKLRSVADIFAGITGLGHKGNNAYQVIQPNSFSDTGTLCVLEAQFRDEEVPSKQTLLPGDILVKRLNPSFVYVATENERGAIASQNLLVVRPGPLVDSMYLAFLLEQREIIGQIEHMSGTAAAIKAISIKKVAEISIPVPPIEDQKRIGEIWRLSRRRKALLQSYIAESDKLVSMIATKIMMGQGEK